MVPSKLLQSRSQRTTLNWGFPFTPTHRVSASMPRGTLFAKAFSICTGLLFGAVFLFAQSKTSTRSNAPLFGPVGIVSIMTQSTTDKTFDDISSRFGFGGGMHLRVYPDDAVALQFGATFIQRGAFASTDTSALFAGSTAVTITVNYVCLDAIANWLVVRNERSAIRLFAGPYLDVFMSGTTDVAVTSSIGTHSSTDTLTTEDVKSTGFGIAFGAGLDLNVGTGVLAFNARYDLGITDIATESMTDDAVFNRGFQIQLSYLFRL